MKKNKFVVKVKKIAKNIWKEICLLVKKCYKNFMKLKPTVRYIIGVWVAVFLILVLFIMISSRTNKIVDSHTEFEKIISAATLDYVKENEIYPSSAKPLKISIDALKYNKYLKDSDIKDKSCKGYSVSYYNDNKGTYDIKSYVTCDKYTTEGYSK